MTSRNIEEIDSRPPKLKCKNKSSFQKTTVNTTLLTYLNKKPQLLKLRLLYITKVNTKIHTMDMAFVFYLFDSFLGVTSSIKH